MEHCLRYFYYFTVDDQRDEGQAIAVSIESDDGTNSEVEIDRLNCTDLPENRWYQRDVDFSTLLDNAKVSP